MKDTKQQTKNPLEVSLLPRIEFHGISNKYIAVCSDGFKLAFRTQEEAKSFLEAECKNPKKCEVYS